jgi:small neutral amino acid transporter SnatA (MarC family)
MEKERGVKRICRRKSVFDMMWIFRRGLLSHSALRFLGISVDRL